MAGNTTDTTKKKKKRKKKKHRLFWFMIKLQIVLMLVVVAAFGYYCFGGYAQEVQQLKHEAATMVAASDESLFVPSQTSEVYDTNGNLISERKGEKDAEYLSYEDIPKDFVAAMISIEDKKFYSHSGVDFKAVARAAKAFVKAKLNKTTSSQGASTITMQLAKLMYMEPDKTWQYKVEQMFLAMELEKRYSKEKIMEFYLNNIYFSNGYYGIEAACHGYFNCEPGELNLSQVAFLCAIPNSPSYYDPVVNFDNTIGRRDRILKNMLEDGKISQETYYEAVKTDIELNRPQESSGFLSNNYVDTYTYYCATRALMEQEGFVFRNYFESNEQQEAYEAEYDELFAACQKRLYAGGYKIYTSIDMDKQNELQAAVDDALAGFTDTYEDGAYEMQGAAVCIDNESGYVAAIVGGREQDLGPYTLNRAYQSHRQPGSSIKPLIVYTPAFERGYDPDTIVDDHELEDGPSNSNGAYAGEVPLRYAVEQSLNTVAWQIYEELTPTVGLSYLKNMGFTNIVDADYIPATALGGFTKGVSALEMAAAYAALENDGMYRSPTCIKSIIDSDENIVYASQQAAVVVYDKTAARMMTDVLTSVMQKGTGKKMNLKNMPCAGKTGTTNDHKDGWFVGYTRYYTTSVWVGCDYPREIKNLSGSSYPGTIWRQFMTAIHKGLPEIEFLPYAQLSEEFIDQQLQEQQEQQDRREEGQQDPDGQPEENGDNTGADTDEPANDNENGGQDADGAEDNGGEDINGDTGGENTGGENEGEEDGGGENTGGSAEEDAGADTGGDNAGEGENGAAPEAEN
ncbi:MAG: transglycosylase domain-containing protein [Muribaculaceae bacterium]|nr:transglycosylase domain-containing protein [Roseburia sp.]MCM1431339.1 transglycosylase domain-containing protein [Muribaculaceae bacterium]MCM1491781.1 transglycosylase domain-containing protein [Muribaculaceae bacterium]